MKVLIVRSGDITRLKDALKKRNDVGVEWLFTSNYHAFFSDVKTRGLVVDKVVFICNTFTDLSPEQHEEVVQNIIHVASLLRSDNAMLLVDPDKQFSIDYDAQLSIYNNVLYYNAPMRITELCEAVLGAGSQQAVKTSVDTTASKDAAKPPKEAKHSRGFFRELSGMFKDAARKEYGSKKTEPVQEPQPTEQTQEPQSAEPQATEPIMTQPVEVPLFSAQDLAEGEEDSTAVPGMLDLNDLIQPPPQSPQPQSPTLAEPPQPPQPEPQPQLSQPPQPEPQPQLSPQSQSPQPPASKEQSQRVKPKGDYAKTLARHSRMYVVSGDRRNGTTTTCANLAAQAAKDGLNVLIIDLDITRKGMFLSFDFEYNDNDQYETLTLFHALRNPSRVEQLALNLAEGLSMVSTSPCVDSSKVYEGYITAEYTTRLVDTALSKYDAVFIDVPYQTLQKIPAILSRATRLVVVTQTDYAALVNLVNLYDPELWETSDYSLLIQKSCFLLNAVQENVLFKTQINDKTLPAVLAELTDNDIYLDIETVGCVPHINNINKILKNGENLLVSTNEYSKMYCALMRSLVALS